MNSPGIGAAAGILMIWLLEKLHMLPWQQIEEMRR